MEVAPRAKTRPIGGRLACAEPSSRYGSWEQYRLCRLQRRRSARNKPRQQPFFSCVPMETRAAEMSRSLLELSGSSVDGLRDLLDGLGETELLIESA
jgi:hypothetical protein